MLSRVRVAAVLMRSPSCTAVASFFACILALVTVYTSLYHLYIVGIAMRSYICDIEAYNDSKVCESCGGVSRSVRLGETCSVGYGLAGEDAIGAKTCAL